MRLLLVARALGNLIRWPGGLGAALFPDLRFVTCVDATRLVSWAVQIAVQVLSGMYVRGNIYYQ